MTERRVTWATRAAVAAAMWVAPAAATAHKVNLFAWAEGPTIRGEAYFTGGGRPQNLPVEVLDAAGRPLAQTKTDAEGRFAYTPARRCEHRFVIETEDGHRAECKVSAADLPASLPPAAGGAPAAVPSPQTQPAAHRPAAATAPSEPLAVSVEALRREVRQTVRRELEAYEQRVRIRDVIGGIGYIFGLAGLAMLLRRRKAERAGTAS